MDIKFRLTRSPSHGTRAFQLFAGRGYAVVSWVWRACVATVAHGVSGR
jgi:hypothetical protein